MGCWIRRLFVFGYFVDMGLWSLIEKGEIPACRDIGHQKMWL